MQQQVAAEIAGESPLRPALQVFRLRVVLRITRKLQLQPYQAMELYALLSHANGLAHNMPAAIPDGLILQAPELCRTLIHGGGEFAFGFTLLEEDAAVAARRLRKLKQGLQQAGKQAGLPKAVLGNNFRVAAFHDLIAGVDLPDKGRPEPLSDDIITAEVSRLTECSQLTVRFETPFRAERPEGQKRTSQAYYDRRYFSPAGFLRKVHHRLVKLGWPDPVPEINSDAPLSPELIKPLDNQLVWIDYNYGPKQRRKMLSGAAGDVVIARPSEDDLLRLVWGQHLHVGGATRFGFGRYRILEAGPDPYPCTRSQGLVSLAFSEKALDSAAAEFELDPGVIQQGERAVEAGTYQPAPCSEFTLRAGNKERLLRIPTRIDRALQRVVHDFLAGPLDRFFEESSFAYRKKLGRHQAARHLKRLYNQGYQWAVKADFRQFFNTVPHSEIRNRLRAWLNDPALERLIGLWLESGQTSPGLGLPTGAVLSPLLSNLLLDQFDEQIEQEGGKLVRYADDFLILGKDRASIQRIYDQAREIAQALQLELNNNKTSWLDLREPFEFLGFRFARGSEWSAQPLMEPRPLDELAWAQQGSQPASVPVKVSIPGESNRRAGPIPGLAILGPGIEWLSFKGNQLQYSYWSGGSPVKMLEIASFDQLIVIGNPALTSDFVRGFPFAQLPVDIVDSLFRLKSSLHAPARVSDPQLVARQFQLRERVESRLRMSRELIAAKVSNYAALAAATAEDDVITQLRALIPAVEASQSLNQLRGLEGTAARIWFQGLNARLPGEYRFERRVAPDANDPANVLLNLGYTMLARLVTRLLTGQGFLPTIGFLHDIRVGHEALTSDMMEPYRFLVDAAVLETLWIIPTEQFEEQPDGWPRLKIKPRAFRELTEQLHRRLATCFRISPGADAIPYRIRLHQDLRRFRAALMTEADEWRAFRLSPAPSLPMPSGVSQTAENVH